MNTKKLPMYFLIFLLTLGASLTLGFLSFGGVFAVLPFAGVALGGFILSVVYEAEIYFQNISGAFKKLFKFNYFEKLLVSEFLQNELVNILNENNPPKFFMDYQQQLHLSHNSHDSLEKKKLKAMEKWLAIQLFSEKKHQKDSMQYQKDLASWIKNDKRCEAYQQNLIKRTWMFRGVGAFSILAGIFMGLGTTYLVVEVLTVFHIAFLTLSIPAAVIPLFSLIFLASAAYAFLTYHAITDMINNDTLRKWYQAFMKSFNEGFTFRNVCMTILAIALALLAVSLTLCTAGTWWTIAQNTKPFFSFMAGSAENIIKIVMGIINPPITIISTN